MSRGKVAYRATPILGRGREWGHRPRRWGAVATVAAGVVLAVMAGTVQSPRLWAAGDANGAAGALSPTQYRLAPGDRIGVTVFGQPDLSGDFPLDGAGMVVLPVVGPVSVMGMTVADAQKAILARFSDGILVSPTVSVRVSEHRPIAIIGDVASPGTFPFRFGLSVKGAIALAGGPPRGQELLQNRLTDFVVSEERVRILETSRENLLVRVARLEAQLDEGASGGTARVQRMGLRADEFKRVADNPVESEILRRSVRAQAQRLSALNEQRIRIDEEIKFVRSRSAKEELRYQLAAARTSELEQSMKRGYVKRSVFNEQMREQARVESDMGQLEAQMSRLRRDMAEVDLRIEEATAEYNRVVLSDLQDVQQRLRETEVSLASARQIREIRAVTVGATGDDELGFRIEITRVVNDRAETIAATMEMLVQPGDVIEIKSRRPVSKAGHFERASLPWVRDITVDVTPIKDGAIR